VINDQCQIKDEMRQVQMDATRSICVVKQQQQQQQSLWWLTSRWLTSLNYVINNTRSTQQASWSRGDMTQDRPKMTLRGQSSTRGSNMGRHYCQTGHRPTITPWSIVPSPTHTCMMDSGQYKQWSEYKLLWRYGGELWC